MILSKRECILVVSLLAAILLIYILVTGRNSPRTRTGKKKSGHRNSKPSHWDEDDIRAGDDSLRDAVVISSESVSESDSESETSVKGSEGESVSLATSGGMRSSRGMGRRSSSDRKTLQMKWKREEICRSILEEIYQKPFLKIRPKFLRSPKTNRCLELDCYNEELKIALEHSGWQHFRKNSVFNSGKTDYRELRKRDIFKQARCEELGLHLILVPEDVPEKRLREFIKFYLPHEVERRSEMRKEGWPVPDRPFQTPSTPGYVFPTFDECTELSELGPQ